MVWCNALRLLHPTKSLAVERIAHYRTTYADILVEGAAVNPRAPPSGKRGRTRQNKALNLIDRLRSHTEDVWRFMTDHNVPFTNNTAEQAVRMPKVKQKISGGFRTQALTLTFQGYTPQPRFA